MDFFQPLEPRVHLSAADFVPEGATAIVGDWDGDGDDDFGGYVPISGNKGELRIDLNGDGELQDNEVGILKGKGLTLVAGDWNADGADSVGWFKKGKFRFDANGDLKLNGKDVTYKLGNGKFTEGAVADVNNDGLDDLAIRKPGEDWQVHLWDNIDYKKLAKSLKKADVTFFGAWWCPHCADQKAIFKDGYKKLPYVECSTPDGDGQKNVCVVEDIRSYPTWEFADGSRVEAVVSATALADEAGVDIPTAKSNYNKAPDGAIAELPA